MGCLFPGTCRLFELEFYSAFESSNPKQSSIKTFLARRAVGFVSFILARGIGDFGFAGRLKFESHNRGMHENLAV